MTFQYSLKSTWLIVIGFVILGDFLFYRNYLGTNFGIFCLVLVMIVAPYFKGQRGSWLVIFFACMSLLLDVTVLNFFFFILVFIFVIYTRELNDISYTVFFVLRSLLIFGFHSLGSFVIDLKTTIENTLDLKAHAKMILKRAMYWFVAMGISGQFLFLFYLANPFLQFNIERFFTWFINSFVAFFERYLFIRVAIWSLIFLSVWSFLRTRQKQETIYNEPEKRDWLPLEFIIICLCCFNFVFAIQNITDLYFLLGSGVLPKGLSHAEYAHRGAYPLIVVTLISGALICYIFKDGFRSQKSNMAKALVYFWLFQNILLVGFTFQRLVFYVSEYQLTRWRYATFIWLFLIVIGFVLTFCRIYYQKSNRWYLRQNMYASVLVLLICCFVKSDSLIAYYNVSHCKEFSGKGKSLDIEYLESLGVSALPGIEYALKNKPEAMSALIQVRKVILEKHSAKANNWRESSMYESVIIYFAKEY